MVKVDEVAEEDDDDERDQKSETRFRGTRTRDLDFLKKYAKRDGCVIRPSGMHYKALKSGDRSAPRPGPRTPCLVHYRGMLTDGTEFDNSYKRGEPALLRPEQVVEGWREAMQLMREGDRWEIILPSHLAYGERGAGPIPGGAVLIFELEMLAVNPKEEAAEGGLFGFSWPKILAIAVLTLVLFYFFMWLLKGGSPKRGPTVDLEDAIDSLNPHVYFDVDIGGTAAGRIEMELFPKVAPRTVENFRALATGELGVGTSGKRLHYKASRFHRIVPGFVCQGGDFVSGNGRGGESIYGRTFKDEWEHGVVHHSRAGLLSMANRGRDTQSSQFFITLSETSWLDNLHVVFGRIVKGMDVLHQIEAAGSKSGKPNSTVIVADCGEVDDEEDEERSERDLEDDAIDQALDEEVDVTTPHADASTDIDDSDHSGHEEA